ncbi:hypothetical protein BDN72DRAFT_434453 [Pluteus cervinus]|uniref:Uncharacterized protein n=1 Tax=Pluteus cervinus TaxID=181527 RepID=A0ACD3B0Q8_9AGAR|nr:hypothetical protein BDN72DRAFT_434453 [Pluteus cervinus]
MDIDILDWFMSPRCAFDLSELSKFHCFKSPDETSSYSLCQKFVNFIATSLQDLALSPPLAFGQITHPHPVHPVSATTQFNPIPNLSCLRLSLIQNTAMDPRSIHLPWAIKLLANLSHPQNPQYLDISYDFNDWDHSKPVEAQLDSYEYYLDPSRRQIIGWDDFDDLLSSKTFASLHTIHFAVLSRRKILYPVFKAILPKLLPKLNQKGLLKVTRTNELGLMSEREFWYYCR